MCPVRLHGWHLTFLDGFLPLGLPPLRLFVVADSAVVALEVFPVDTSAFWSIYHVGEFQLIHDIHGLFYAFQPLR